MSLVDVIEIQPHGLRDDRAERQSSRPCVTTQARDQRRREPDGEHRCALRHRDALRPLDRSAHVPARLTLRQPVFGLQHPHRVRRRQLLGQQLDRPGAPYGYRFVKKTDIADGYWEINESEAEVVREIFRRYTEDGCSIGALARWLSEQGIPTRTGKAVWDRSTVWGMLRNPAYHGQAAYGKTKVVDRHGKPTRTTRARGERRGRRQVRLDEPVDQWLFIPVAPLITEETFALAQERLGRNAHFAKRNTKAPTLLQGILVCRECGYACYRSSTRTTNKRIYYYRCVGSDNYRHVGGRVCQSRPIRADELDGLVWDEVRRLLEDPALVRAEIDRRFTTLRTEHPATRRREALERDLTRATSAIEPLIEAYQEQLISLEELRARMPTLRKRQSTLQAQLDTLDAELHDAETYLKLADTLESFLTRLSDGLDQLTLDDQQRILRLVVREVLIGGDDDKVTIRHSIPTPIGNHDDQSCLLRGSSRPRPLWRARWRRGQGTLLAHDPRGEGQPDQRQDAFVGHPTAYLFHQETLMDRPETVLDVSFDHPLIRAGGVDEEPHLLDGVLRSAPGPEPVRGRAKVRLEDRLEHELGRRLSDPVAYRRDAQASELPRTLRDQPLARRQRTVGAILQLLAELGEDTIHAYLLDSSAGLTIDTGGP